MIKIKWRGTASLSIRSENTTLEIDPYLHSLNKALPQVDKEEVSNANAIFITHPHPDHFYDIDSFTGKNAPVYVSRNGIDRAKKGNFYTENMNCIVAGEKYTVGDFTVKVYASKHCRYDAGIVFKIIFSLRTYRLAKNAFKLLYEMMHFPIADDVYAFELETEGKHIFLLGSAGLNQDVVYPTNADLLIFPYQGRSDMAKYSLPLIERLAPKRILLDHIDDAFPPFTSTVNTDGIVKAVNERLPSVPIEPFIVGKEYEI
jgi:hypothetical protein